MFDRQTNFIITSIPYFDPDGNQQMRKRISVIYFLVVAICVFFFFDGRLCLSFLATLTSTFNLADDIYNAMLGHEVVFDVNHTH